MDPQSLDEIHGFLQSGFPSIKLFTVYRGTLMLEKAGVYEVMKMIAREGGLALVHAESADMIERNIADAIREGRTDARAHALSRPPVTELEAMYGVYAMARETGAPVILAHMTTGKVMELFGTLKRASLRGGLPPLPGSGRFSLRQAGRIQLHLQSAHPGQPGPGGSLGYG